MLKFALFYFSSVISSKGSLLGDQYMYQGSDPYVLGGGGLTLLGFLPSLV